MIKIPEKEYTKKSILQLIWDRYYISRREVAQILNIDQRTVASYAQALEEMQIISREDLSKSKGRPMVYYRPLVDKLAYLGVYVYKDLYLSLGNVDRYQTDFGKVIFDDNNLDMERSLAEINKMMERNPGLNLIGIGMVIHCYRISPARKKFFLELGRRLKEQFPIDICQCNMASASLLAYAMRHDFHPYRSRENSYRLGMIDPSDSIILGLYINDMPYPYTANGNKQFAAIKKGVMNHRMILDAYRELTGKSLDVIMYYRLLLSNDDPAAMEIMKREARQLAGAVIRFQKQYQLEKVFISHIHLKTLDEIKRLLGGAVQVDIMVDTQMENIAASLRLAMHCSTGGFYRFH